MDELDSLHQRASAHYLQGNAEDALAAWEQLLKLAPQDERAIEGIRLCRHALRAHGGQDADDELSPLAAAFAELDHKLNLARAESPAPPCPSSNSAEPGMDLAWSLEDDSTGDAPPADAASPAPSTTPLAMTGWEWDADADATLAAAEEGPARIEVAASPAEAPAPAVEVPAAEVERNAALELRRRANELLAHALAAMEAGSPDEALRTLDRVLILDETNDAARSLKEKIAEAQGREALIAAPSDRSARTAPSGSAARQSSSKEIDLGPGDEQTLALDRPAPAVVSAVDPAAAPKLPESSPEGPRAKGELGQARPAVADKPASRKWPSLAIAWRVDRRSWPVIAAVVAVGSGAILYYLSGVGTGPSAPPREEGRIPAGARAAVPSSPEPCAEAVEEAPATPDPQTLFERANAAFAAEDYSAAIVGYNAVLKVDPAHAAASSRLKEAGERYREIRETQERWDQARKAFDAADYREALRLFYRLPQDKSPELVARYKVNGWYNLGVQALRSGDCKEALTNFEDARAIQQSDEGLADVLRLAHTCSRDAESRQLPITLPLRSLDD